MSDGVKVSLRANGPYVITGPITLLDAEGNAFTLERESVTLCRCGHSANKPFCDGNHRQTGFESSPKAE